MDFSTFDEAEALWNDVIDLLRGRGVPASKLAMIEGCEPVSFNGQTLTVSASRFVKLQLEKDAKLIEECLQEIAFQPISLSVQVGGTAAQAPKAHATVSEQESVVRKEKVEPVREPHAPKVDNPLYEAVTDADSKLTFERFVRGEENLIAYEAAMQVAEGINKNYNPLFIYGRSGVGKTHLLKAIQNYVAKNEPWRLCVYRVAADFIKDYTSALQDKSKGHMEELEEAYRDVDILIIDDVQHLRGAASTITFFFNTFNYLREHGKQIVIAADESPMALGMGEKGFDERITSRFDSGFSCPIQVPDYELKRNLIASFYQQMKEDAENEHLGGYTGTISEENLDVMAERSGSNIRVIRSLCQSCLLEASKKEEKGSSLTKEDIVKIASRKFANMQRIITIEQVQRAVENEYQISHDDLVGSKRAKEIMEPRHVAIWLTRELTDNTLETIGRRFGGRTHATVKNSIRWIDESMRQSRLFYDRINHLKDEILEE